MFQARLYRSIGDLKVLLSISDDILLYGKGKDLQEATEDHDWNLLKFLQYCREIGMKLYKEKVKLKLTNVVVFSNDFDQKLRYF